MLMKTNAIFARDIFSIPPHQNAEYASQSNFRQKSTMTKSAVANVFQAMSGTTLLINVCHVQLQLINNPVVLRSVLDLFFQKMYVWNVPKMRMMILL